MDAKARRRAGGCGPGSDCTRSPYLNRAMGDRVAGRLDCGVMRNRKLLVTCRHLHQPGRTHQESTQCDGEAGRPRGLDEDSHLRYYSSDGYYARGKRRARENPTRRTHRGIAAVLHRDLYRTWCTRSSGDPALARSHHRTVRTAPRGRPSLKSVNHQAQIDEKEGPNIKVSASKAFASRWGGGDASAVAGQ